MQSKILVFIPAYNCIKQLPRVLSKFIPEIQKLFIQILVVDNRSEDGTIDVAKKSLKNLLILG